jgi:hypothetical protein
MTGRINHQSGAHEAVTDFVPDVTYINLPHPSPLSLPESLRELLQNLSLFFLRLSHFITKSIAVHFS